MTRPVSVIVPVHDGERYLAEALESVFGQTVAPREVVVVDDASTDRSVEIAQGFGDLVRVVSSGARHPDRTRAIGVEAATHELVAFCDADDRWAPTKLERQLEVLGESDGPVLVWTGLEEFVSPELVGSYTGRPPAVDVRRPRLVGALLTTRETCRLGEPSLADCGSWVAWVAGLPPDVESRWADEALLLRRLHDRNHSTTNQRARQAWLRAARARAQRAREDPAP